MPWQSRFTIRMLCTVLVLLMMVISVSMGANVSMGATVSTNNSYSANKQLKSMLPSAKPLWSVALGESASFD
jgi:hypothetical protein